MFHEFRGVLKRRRRPSCLGTGLLTLDLVYKPENNLPLVATGGSCGNVMSILSQYGWNTYPASNIGNDVAADLIIRDLSRFSVNVDLIEKKAQLKTPVILEFIREKNGMLRHEFSRTCHKSRQKLPRYTPINSGLFQKIKQNIYKYDVYYLDRLNQDSLALAKEFKKQNKIVFFEPQLIQDDQETSEMLSVADILKVSASQVEKKVLLNLPFKPAITLVTHGSEGLEYTLRNKREDVHGYLEAFPSRKVRDASGCGDWLSATLIKSICSDGIENIDQLDAQQLIQALNSGQKKSLQNLHEWGARGGMYKGYKQLIKCSKQPSIVNVKGRYPRITRNSIRPVDLLDKAWG